MLSFGKLHMYVESFFFSVTSWYGKTIEYRMQVTLNLVPSWCGTKGLSDKAALVPFPRRNKLKLKDLTVCEGKYWSSSMKPNT